MSTTNDNFEALWARLKESISERREPQSVYTLDGPMTRDYFRFTTGAIDLDENNRPIVSTHAGRAGASLTAYARKEDLIAIAEHCLLRAAQFDQPYNLTSHEPHVDQP
jgi:hypothetical protein